MPRKILYLIPGYGESSIDKKDYKKIIKLFERFGFTVRHVKIDWQVGKPTQFKNFTEQFLSQYKKEPASETYVFGFSFGAMIAFLTASKTKPTLLILSSLSPYFIEDQKSFSKSLLNHWREDFIKSDYLFSDFSSKITSKTCLTVGELEHRFTLKRARDARKSIKNSTLSIIKNGKHAINQKRYLKTIERILSRS